MTKKSELAVKSTAVTLLGKSTVATGVEITSGMRRFAEAAGMDLSLPVEKRMCLVMDAGNRAITSVMEAGIWLMSVRADTAHGRFEDLLLGIGLPARTAQKWMQQARFYVALPEADRGKLLSLTSRQVLALSSAQFEAAEALVLESTGEELQAESVAELMRKLEKREREVLGLRDDLDKSASQIKILTDRQMPVLQRKRNAPADVEDLQDECLVAVRKVQQCLDTLGKQAEAAVAIEGAWGEGCRRHVVVSAQAIAVEAMQLLADVSASLGVDAEAPLPVTAMVDISRANEVHGLYTQMTVSHETAARNRQLARDEKRKKDKGRPGKARPTLTVDE